MKHGNPAELEELVTVREMARPRNALKLAAGVIGIVFDRLQGIEPEERRVDDLTIINGIGPTFAKRLEAAGIRTFGQLAAMTPAQLVELLGLKPWQADPAEWIAQAQALV